MTKTQVRELIREFDRGFIPMSGGLAAHGSQTVENVRHTEGLERCCARVGDDDQSGPIYCGDLADFVADVKGHEGVRVALCRCHAGRCWRDEVEKLL